MRVISAKEFHDKSSKLIRSKEALVVTRHGKDVLGIYYPRRSQEIPKEAEWDMFKALANQFSSHLKQKGFTEEDVLGQVNQWRHEYQRNRR